jgi:hypothetical protein
MSLLKADTIKPVTSGGDLSLQGDSGGSAVDCLNITSAGDLNFSGNTDAKIKLPSAGGIYESDGSTAILTESGGAVTLDNVALGSSVTGAGLFQSYAIINQTAAYNANGGVFGAATDVTRVLDTEVADPDSIVITLSSNQFTLAAGSYLIQWAAPATDCDSHWSWLYDITGTAISQMGSVEYGLTTNFQTMSIGSARVTPSGSNVYEIRHRCTDAGGTAYGLGRATGVSGYSSIYTSVNIFKEA